MAPKQHIVQDCPTHSRPFPHHSTPLSYVERCQCPLPFSGMCVECMDHSAKTIREFRPFGKFSRLPVHLPAGFRAYPRIFPKKYGGFWKKCGGFSKILREKFLFCRTFRLAVRRCRGISVDGRFRKWHNGGHARLSSGGCRHGIRALAYMAVPFVAISNGESGTWCQGLGSTTTTLSALTLDCSQAPSFLRSAAVMALPLSVPMMAAT